MPSKKPVKNKKIFEEDLSVFEGIQKRDAKVAEVSPQQALETLLKLGFKIQPPSTEQDIQAHEDTINLLGIVEPSKSVKGRKKKVKKEVPEKLKATLYFGHNLSTGTYGPGEIELDISEKDLFNSLLKQDQMCLQQFREPFLPRANRCYIIKEGTVIAKSKYRKVEVSEGAFNSSNVFEDSCIEAVGNADLHRQGIPIPQYIPFGRNTGF